MRQIQSKVKIKTEGESKRQKERKKRGSYQMGNEQNITFSVVI